MRKTGEKIFVTKTTLPPLKEYKKYLGIIWKNNWITNHGPLTLELEKKLKKILGVKHLFFVSNGTVALEIAIKALGIGGEILTTPFSYVATTSSIIWTNCKAKFVDIDKRTLNINPALIEKAITSRTKAILATHVYGNPCDVEKINTIARKYKLKVIYDAAHCFGVRYKNTSILNYGNISTISFHATKLFHSAEGGAVITNNDSLAHKISYMRNFGHNGQEKFWGLGINGKNSELHAAMGLCLLPFVKQNINKRKIISEMYGRLLSGLDLRRPELRKNTDYNYSYYPVLFNSEDELLSVRDSLNSNNIFPRRYFYPALSNLNYVQKSRDIKRICSIIKNTL
jgi:dTDP-4-amino-4,6-dideoxygalactose transaminase